MAEENELEDTLRSDFEAAISEVEGDDAFNDDGSTPEENARHAEQEAPAAQAEKTQDEISGQGDPAAAPDPDRGADTKPPLDWNIDTKQKWADLPNDVKQAISDREMAVNYLMQDTADARATHDDVGNLVNGYAPVFAAEGYGDNPLAGVQGLLNITATLQQGSPQQKAERIAGLISHYGIDVGVLDSLLVGEPGQDPQVSQMQQMIDQRMAPMDQLLQQANQANYNNQYAAEQEASLSIDQFGADDGNRFFEDVRYVMADFLDMAANNQQSMSLQEAYDRACASNPQIADIVAQERANAQQSGNAGNARRKANAASSISGRRQGGVMADGDMDMRSVMESAWDDQARA